MLFEPCILVCGEGLVARVIADGLRAARHRVLEARDLEECSPRLASARAMVLADPLPDSRSLVQTLGALAGSRPRRRAPLRVIMTFAGPRPTVARLPEGAPVALELLDLEHQAARIWLARRPLHGAMDPLFGQQAHILMAGTAAPYRALSLEAMHLAHYGGKPPVFTLASADPEGQRRSFLAEYPSAERFCRLRFAPLHEPGLAAQPAVTCVYVCESAPEQGLETARSLTRLIADLQQSAPPVHLSVGAAEPAGKADSWDGQIFPFSWLREVCRAEVLLDGRGDELAQVIHEHYRDSVAAQGRDPDKEAGGQPWKLLANSYRDANRHQADHLWAKLALTDCRAVPVELVESFAFAPLETERLAAIEHARWAADRYLDGWTYAPERDNTRKRHPQLVPYEDLSEPMKDLDRFAVRLVPTLLARSGRGVVRILIVGVAAADDACRTGSALRRLADLALERLSSRHPDRCLVLASTLEDSACRLLVRRALERVGGALFLLCPRPLPETLASQPDEQSRLDLLDLTARAERRIGLRGERGVKEWYERRVEIVLLIGQGTAPRLPRKQARLDPQAGVLDWNFEY